MLYRRVPLLCLALTGVTGVTGCLPQPKVIDNSQQINGGVNLVPAPVLAAEKQPPSTAPAARAGNDVIETILESDQKHYDLAEVLNRSGLVPLLQTAGPYTVLAPTDAAFDKLPPGLLDELLEPKNHDKLVAFARYHLLRGAMSFAEMVQTNGQVQTMDGPATPPKVGVNSPARPMGSAVIIKGIAGKVMINDTNVIRTDTAANNGIIQWIDGVLIPPAALDNHTPDAGAD